MIEQILSDVRLAVRSLARSPGFTLVAALTLALGIGATTAIFSVVNAVLFRPLPYEDPESLVLLTHSLTAGDVAGAGISGPDYRVYEEQADLFEGTVATFATATNITGDPGADGVVLSWVTPNFFDLLGVGPALGRAFTQDDVVSIDPRVFQDPNITPPPLRAVLSHGFWQRRWGGDPTVIGEIIQVNGQAMEVIGIVPPGFRLFLPADATIPSQMDLWTIWPFELGQMPRAPTGIVTVLGRLGPGVSIEQAQDQVTAVATRLREDLPGHDQAGVQPVLASIHDEVVAHVEPALMILLGSVAFVLLIACANVANLLLVRASAREKEIAVRRALGAGRGAILRAVLTESAILALLGAGGGLLLAAGGIELLLALRPENLPRVESVAMDGPILTFTLGVSFLCALIFGGVPAFQSRGADVSGVLHERSNSGSAGKQRLRSGLIVAEVALSVTLLVGAGLMLRSFVELTRVEPGFDPENVITFQISLPVFAYRPNERADFLQLLRERLTDFPGVEAAGGVYPLPLAEETRRSAVQFAVRQGDQEEWVRNEADLRGVVPGYFEAMGIELLAGRYLSAADNRSQAEPVTVVDRKAANRIWPGEDPVGRSVWVGRPQEGSEDPGSVRLRVAGVVEHTRYATLALEGRQTFYVPYRINSSDVSYFAVKTSADVAAAGVQIRELVRGLDPDIPVLNVRTMDSYVAEDLAPTRFTLVLLAVFAGVALILALVGLYGVIAYTIRQRNHEIGIRLALGASRPRILAMVIGRGLLLTTAGAAAGLLVAWGMNGALASLLYGVSGTDTVTYAGISMLLVTVGTAACWLPARRAARVEPTVALRAD